MKIAVRYYTKTGNTKRMAEAVAEAVGVEALPISEPVTEPVDILFLGNSYYAFTIATEVREFISSLDKEKVGKIVNFGSAAFKSMHIGRPNEIDLEELKGFARIVGQIEEQE